MANDNINKNLLFQETNDQTAKQVYDQSETTELPVNGQDDYYELIKHNLFLRSTDLCKYPNDQESEWLIQVYNIELENGQKELISKLVRIIRDFGDCNTSEIQQFLENNKDNQDLKAVLNLKVGGSELALLHILPGALRKSINNYHDLMDCLLKAGADPSIKDYQGRTPLHHTDYIDGSCFIDLLVKNGADPNVQDNKGRTPLHCAARSDFCSETIDSLLQAGADPNIKDYQGRTPMQIAIDKSNYSIIEHLFTDSQKKLSEELYKMIYGTRSKPEDPYTMNDQGVEDLKKFLDEHKNNEDLKIVLSVQDRKGESKVLRHTQFILPLVQFIEVRSLLLEAGATDQQAEVADAYDQLWNDRLLLNAYPSHQLIKLGKFLSKVSEAQDMNELQEIVNEAIKSGVKLNFVESEDNHFTNYVIEKINTLEKNPKGASGILCTLISRGGKLKNFWDSVEVIDKIASEFKAHKANMIKAHGEYIKRSQEFLKIVKSATSGKLNDAEVDNATFYLKYSQDSKIDVAKIIDGARSLGFTQGSIDYGRTIIKIGKSEVEIETQNGKRNYSDLSDNSDVVLTFYTSVGELKVRLYHDMNNNDHIMVEVSSKDTLEKLKGCNEEIGSNCLLGGCSVYDAINKGYFERSSKLMHSEEIINTPPTSLSKTSVDPALPYSNKSKLSTKYTTQL